MFGKLHKESSKQLMSRKKQKEILMQCKDTKEIIKIFKTANEIAKELNIHKTTIGRQIKSGKVFNNLFLFKKGK